MARVPEQDRGPEPHRQRVGRALGAWLDGACGGVDEVLEACVVQPDPNTSSPGTFLLTRQGRWLALELRTSFIGTSAFDALTGALEQVGVPLRTSAPEGLAPKIDYGRVPLVLGLWVASWGTVCAVVVMVGALLVA